MQNDKLRQELKAALAADDRDAIGARVVDALINAGTPWEATLYPTGDSRIDAVLEPRLQKLQNHL
ncbi:MAG: hypothetical protein V3T72_08395 [Thermoanaerobaculia bacterium]